MNYLGFARKYRPKTFEEVVGQREIAHTLQNAITTNRIHHAYLFCGSKGVGKTSMARIFAKALNCQKGISISPCQECEICQRVATGDDVDVIEIDGASNRGIEEIRNIKDNIKYLPSRARFKIFIIDEIHMLTTAAFNALLKTLEEPPVHVKFIFATTQIHSIPDTILSRCQRFNFKKIEIQDVVEQLKRIAREESLEAEEEVFTKIAQTTNGAMRDSLVLLDQLAAYNAKNITIQSLKAIRGSEGEEAGRIIHAIAEKNVLTLLGVVADFFSIGGNVENLMESLIQKFRDILVLQVTGGSEAFVEGTQEYQKWLLEKKDSFSQEFLHSAIYQIVEAKNLVHRSLLGKIILETTLLKIFHLDSLVSLKVIEKKLYDLQEKIALKGSASAFVPRPVSDMMPPSTVSVGLRNIQSGEKALHQNQYTQAPGSQAMPIQSASIVETNKTIQGNEKSVQQQPQTSGFSAMRSPAERQEQGVQERMVVAPSIPMGMQPVLASVETAPILSPWEKFVDGIKKISPSMGDFLHKKAQYEIKEESLIIIIPQANHIIAETISSPKNKKAVSDCIFASFHKALPLRFSFSGEEKAVEHKEYQKNLTKDPMIGKAIEIFEARILETQKI